MIYLTVLVASAIVMVVGVSALLAVRIEHRAAAGANRAGEARIHARSAIELALERIAGDPNWRSSHTHNQWSDGIEVGGGVLRYKLVDTQSTDLAADATSRVWLYGRATHGQIERITRVLLQPKSQLPASNLLRNTRMDQGAHHWWTDTSTAHLRYTNQDQHAGSGSLYLKRRTQPEAGIGQDVAGGLENGRVYRLSAWVRMPDDNDYMILQLYTRDTVDGEQWHGALSDKVAGSPWRHVRATVTPRWSGTLEAAAWYIRTEEKTDAFFVDEARLTTVAHDHQMTPVPGTWERIVY